MTTTTLILIVLGALAAVGITASRVRRAWMRHPAVDVGAELRGWIAERGAAGSNDRFLVLHADGELSRPVWWRRVADIENALDVALLRAGHDHHCALGLRQHPGIPSRYLSWRLPAGMASSVSSQLSVTLGALTYYRPCRVEITTADGQPTGSQHRSQPRVQDTTGDESKRSASTDLPDGVVISRDA